VLEASEITPDNRVEASGVHEAQPGRFRALRPVHLYVFYALALGVSISMWFLAIRAPLWLDETVSFYVIKGGFSKILVRQGWPGVPAYSYFLWLWTKAMGTSEIALRMSSVLPMLGAVYLLYRSARDLFDWDVAMIAAVVYCLHPIVIPESIDVRPYALAAVAITSSIFALLRLRHNRSNWLAALFGFSAACIVYFQILFVVILPALAICFLLLKVRERLISWQQLGVALVVFVLAFLPVIPGLQYMLHTSGIHVFAAAPKLSELVQVLAQKRSAYVLAVTILIAASARRIDLKRPLKPWPVLLCISLALVPILTLYTVSRETSIHVFVGRYRLVAAPGVALCWALILSRIDSRALRLLFCTAIVAVTAYHYFTTPSSRMHNYTWKYALEFAEKNASADNAPVVICSDLPEADYLPMPVGSAVKDSPIFTPLAYYQLTVPVVPLPRSLNDEAIRAGSQFLREAAQRHERFLALAFESSYKTLDWIASNTAATYDVHELGVFDGVKTLEFVPRIQPRIQADASQ
jgi:uncharacterized membrane protein